jgi:hypothetical protein
MIWVVKETKYLLLTLEVRRLSRKLKLKLLLSLQLELLQLE